MGSLLPKARVRKFESEAEKTRDVVIRPLRPPSWSEMDFLLQESEREGFCFLARLRRAYESGAARFDGPGETLLGVYAEGELVAVGGVSADPYEAGPRAGRIRHVYVARARRGQGIGRRLMAALIQAAHPHFDALALRTDTAQAAAFYQALGFQPVADHPHHTHRLPLPPLRG
jgi:GNAT superfamily N-acetyltransferase